MRDIFIAKIDSTGCWKKGINAGGNYQPSLFAITTDAYGNCHITGELNGSLNVGNSELVSTGNGDVFVAKVAL